MCVRADDSCDGIASDVGLKVDVLERNNAGDGYEDIPAYMLFKFGTTKPVDSRTVGLTRR